MKNGKIDLPHLSCHIFAFQNYSSDGALMEHFRTSMEEKDVEIAKLKSANGTLKVGTFTKLT